MKKTLTSLALAGSLALGIGLCVTSSTESIKPRKPAYMLSVHDRSGQVTTYIVDKDSNRYNLEKIEDLGEWDLYSTDLHINTDDINKVDLPKLENIDAKLFHSKN